MNHADPTVQDDDGYTAAELADYNGNVECAMYLRHVGQMVRSIQTFAEARMHFGSSFKWSSELQEASLALHELELLMLISKGTAFPRMFQCQLLRLYLAQMPLN